MRALKLKLTGVPELKRAFSQYESDVQRRLLAATFVTAQDVTTNAKENFAPNIPEDVYVTHLGVPPTPKPPYKGDAGLLPHVRHNPGRKESEELRKNIRHSKLPTRIGYAVGTNVSYAPFVEFGTSRARAHPFLFPAAESERRRHNERIAKALRGAA